MVNPLVSLFLEPQSMCLETLIPGAKFGLDFSSGVKVAEKLFHFLSPGLNLFRDPGIPCLVIQCQDLDFSPGKVTNHTKVDLRQPAG